MPYIEKVYVLNLPHRTDRRNYTLGHLHTIGVDRNIIDVFRAEYGEDYESLNAIIDTAIADGFPEFKNEKEKVEKDTKTRFSYRWNWCRMLRQICESDKITLILLDDRRITIDWQVLNWTIDNLVCHHSPFEILQMGWYFGDTYYDQSSLNIVNGIVAKGFNGFGDWGTVLSPESASKLLYHLLNTGLSPEYLFGKWGQFVGDDTGCFHLIRSEIKGALMDWKQDIIH